MNADSSNEVSPWKLFKTSEMLLAAEISKKISETLVKFSSIDLNSISDADRNVLLLLSDNGVPYEWRKLWQGPKLASEFLKSVAVRVQSVSKFAGNLNESIQEIDFSKIFNVDSFLSTVKLVTSRDLKVSASDLILESYTDSSKREQMNVGKVSVIKISSLLIDGLNFDNYRLVQADATSNNNFTGPIYCFFKETHHDLTDDEPGIFKIPLYATHSREKLLCTFKLNTSLDKDEIIYSGTSLIVPAN